MDPILWIVVGIVIAVVGIRYVTGIPFVRLFKVAEDERRRLELKRIRDEKKQKSES